MTAIEPVGKIDIPKHDNWPGTFEAFRQVKPYIKPQIWNFISALGLVIIASLIIDIFLGIIFKHAIVGSFVNDIGGLIVGAFGEAVFTTMYFKSLNKEDFTLNEVLAYGYHRWLKMLGLVIVMYVILVVSFILLIVPFLLILPRVYLAPYFLIYNDSTVGEAIAASWHLTKGNVMKVYGILFLELGIALLVLTIIGIPFAIYWWIINSGSFALLTMSLAQPKDSAKTKGKNAALKKGKPSLAAKL